MKIKTKAILIVMVALIGVCILAPIVSAESAEELTETGIGFGESRKYAKALVSCQPYTVVSYIRYVLHN